MGYIFDAMNRASDSDYQAGRSRKKGRPPARPEQPVDGQTPDVLHKIDSDPQQQQADAAPTGDNQPPVDNQDQPPSFAFDPQAALDKAHADVNEHVRHVPEDESCIDDRLVALIKPASLMSEEYRSIRTGILARWEHKRHLVHTITSATPQEGKTITSLNLGLSFAELRNRRTIVVEADLRLPQFTSLLSLNDQPGMVGLLEAKVELSDAILELGDTNLHVIVAGGRANDQAVQLLHSTRFVTLIQQLRQRYDHVIIDTPPVVELADAGIIGAMSDDVQLIVRMGRTPKPLVEQAIRTLGSYNAPVAGLIATDQTRHRGRYYYKYGYRYRYRYQYTEKQAA